jgi:hypothetical protein
MSLGIGSFAASGSVTVPLTLTLMTGITARTNSGGSITIPATAQAGDVAIFFQMARNSSGTPGSVFITGATTVANQVAGASNAIRAMLSYKILDAADIGASRTGLNGSSQNYKTIRIIRPSRPITSITTGSVDSAWSGAGFTQTISAPTLAPAFIAGRIFNQQSALSPTGSLFSNGNRLDENTGSTNYATLIEIQNGPTMASRTMGSGAATGVIVGQSFFAVVS